MFLLNENYHWWYTYELENMLQQEYKDIYKFSGKSSENYSVAILYENLQGCFNHNPYR